MCIGVHARCHCCHKLVITFYQINLWHLEIFIETLTYKITSWCWKIPLVIYSLSFVSIFLEKTFPSLSRVGFCRGAWNTYKKTVYLLIRIQLCKINITTKTFNNMMVVNINERNLVSKIPPDNKNWYIYPNIQF